MKRTQKYSAPGITVTFDAERCLHSAVCLMTLPEVFDVSRKRWIRPEEADADAVAAAVARCPTGALRAAREGEREADDPSPVVASVRAALNGPLLVEGPVALVDENGGTIPTTGRFALCRCGGTGNPPFCDNTHKVNGFRPRTKK